MSDEHALLSAISEMLCGSIVLVPNHVTGMFESISSGRDLNSLDREAVNAACRQCLVGGGGIQANIRKVRHADSLLPVAVPFTFHPIRGLTIVIMSGPSFDLGDYIYLKYITDNITQGLTLFELNPDTGCSRCLYAAREYLEQYGGSVEDLFEKGIPAVGDLTQPDDLAFGTAHSQHAIVHRVPSEYCFRRRLHGQSEHGWARADFVTNQIDPCMPQLLLSGALEDFQDYAELLGLQSTAQTIWDGERLMNHTTTTPLESCTVASREAVSILKYLLVNKSNASLDYFVSAELNMYKDRFLMDWNVDMQLRFNLLSDDDPVKQIIAFLEQVERHCFSPPQNKIITAVKYLTRCFALDAAHSLLLLANRLSAHLPTDVRNVLLIELGLVILSMAPKARSDLSFELFMRMVTAATFSAPQDPRFVALQLWLSALVVEKLKPQRFGQLHQELQQSLTIFPESNAIATIAIYSSHSDYSSDY